jgi:hypothetical protein
MAKRPAPAVVRTTLAPARPHTPRRASPLLDLQRTLGNRSVAGLLQRKVGFEFELGNADIRDLTGGVKKRLPKGPTGTWAKADGLDFQADDSNVAADRSDIEFVTTAFDETATERARLDNALGVIEDFANWIPLNRAQLAVKMPLRGVTVTKQDVMFTVDDLTTKPQATVGVRLEKVGTMLQDVFPGAETAGEAQARDPMRAELTGYTSQDYEQSRQSGLSPAEKILTETPRVRPRIDDFHSKNQGPQTSDGLVSIVALVSGYLRYGAADLPKGYAKTIATLMARTDFGTLFSLLSTTEKDYYKADGGKRWLALVQTTTGLTAGELDQPIFVASGKLSLEPSTWYLALTRRKWLVGMTEGTDYLTAKNYPTAPGKRAIEGLGAYGSRMDVVGGTAQAAGPIFEWRVLEYVDLADAATWRPVALNLFDYVVALNRDQAHTWGQGVTF